MNTSLHIKFRQVSQPITEPETKFGGDPVWIDGPQWPLGRLHGNPMQFLTQVAVDPHIFPNAAARMAYLFVTNDGDGSEPTWDPDAGENAVILQPGLPSPVPYAPLYTGPTLWTPGTGPEDPTWKHLEYAAELTLQSEPAFMSHPQRMARSWEEQTQYWEAMAGHKIGGSPLFEWEDWFPFANSHLLLQLAGDGGTPFFLPFGFSRSGWIIANADITEAKFKWG
jgi:hypothetical protein